MADWEVIKIPKRGYGATKEYRWRHFEVGKGEQSNEGWYLTDDKWNIEYNQSREFLDSVRNLWYRHESSSHPDIQSWAKRANLAIPFDSGGDNHDFTIATQAILIEVAKGYDHMSIAREAWLKAKHTKWPIDSQAATQVLFKDGRSNLGFRKAKDAMKVAELIADWQIAFRGWGIINHSFVLNQ